jgi:hypothetical protein
VSPQERAKAFSDGARWAAEYLVQYTSIVEERTLKSVAHWYGITGRPGAIVEEPEHFVINVDAQ